MVMDDVTFEVMRHRLWEINNEIGVLAARMSASPAVYETGDYNTGILTAEGKGLFSGVGVIRMATALDRVVQSVRNVFGDDIGAGDMFITNDPYAGALHAMDVAVVAPVVVKGELVSWTGIVFHQLDVGGPTPGSWSVGATDAYQEPPLLPPAKIVEGGRLRRDVEAMFLRNSRTPDVVGINAHAKMGAQSLAHARIEGVIDEIGLDGYRELQSRIFDDVRGVVQSRIAAIPDGEWRVSTFLEHDGISDSIYELRLRLAKEDQRLVLDFTGTSPQAPGPINCAWGGLVAGVLEVLVPALCTDVPWAHGAVYECIEIISESGTINNAIHPAPTSMATVNACQATSDLVWQAFSRMNGWVDGRREETIALGYGGVNSGTLSGYRDGRRFVLACSGLGGGAARYGGDGVDSGGNIIAPIFAIPNVERLESLAPVLYLWRRERPESAGAGTWRGGPGVEVAIAVHKHDEALEGVSFNTSWAAPAARGAHGGLPGSLQGNLIVDIGDPSEFLRADQLYIHEAATPLEMPALPGKALFGLVTGQVWISWTTGGGGFGDPLERLPQAVRDDVVDARCTADQAHRIYGVVLAGDRVDEEATAVLRLKLRRERGWTPGTNMASPSDDQADLRSIYYSYDLASETYSCNECGHVFKMPRDGRGSEGLLLSSTNLEAISPANAWAGDHGFSVQHACCAGCGRQFATEVISLSGWLGSGTEELIRGGATF